MAQLVWDDTGKKKYTLGIHKVALFVSDPAQSIKPSVVELMNVALEL